MRPLTKETVEMARQGLLMSDWCGFSKRDTVNQLCDLALKGLSSVQTEELSSPEIERSFQMLEACGVPRARAKTVANGIDVLATRFRRDEAFQALMERDAARYRMKRQMDWRSSETCQTMGDASTKAAWEMSYDAAIDANIERKCVPSPQRRICDRYQPSPHSDLCLHCGDTRFNHDAPTPQKDR